jgi:hypothetical protein
MGYSRWAAALSLVGVALARDYARFVGPSLKGHPTPSAGRTAAQSQRWGSHAELYRESRMRIYP